MPLVQCVYDERLPVPHRRACSLSVDSSDRLFRRLKGRHDSLLYWGVVKGTVGIKLEHQSPLTIHPGASLVVRSGHAFSLMRPASSFTVLGVAVGAEVGGYLARQLSDSGDPESDDSIGATHAHIENSPLLQASLQMLTLLSGHEHPRRDDLLDLNVTQLLLHLLQTTARPLLLQANEPTFNPPGLAAAVRHVRRHLHRPFSVDELAEQACMSRSTFYRHFRTTFGVTPLQYVTRMRIEHAKALLRESDRTVTDVSLDLGFSSVSHFIDLFRRRVGLTPQAYQRSLRTSGKDFSRERDSLEDN